MTATTTTAPTAPPQARTAGKIRAADVLERLVWTFVAAFGSALVTPPLAQAAGVHLDLTVLESGLLAGTSAVINYVTLVARWRLDVLPDPGGGLRR